MKEPNEYGLLIESVIRYGTEYIEVTVVRREKDKDYPLGCAADGEAFYLDGAPKHLIGLALDGLGMYGFISDHGDPAFIGDDVEFRNVYSSTERKLARMLKAIKRVNARVRKDEAREPGDKFMSIAKALKLSFAVECLKRGPFPEWRWLSIEEGRNRYRDLIELKVAEANARRKETA